MTAHVDPLRDLIRRRLAEYGMRADAQWCRWPELIKAVEKIVVEDRASRIEGQGATNA